MRKYFILMLVFLSSQILFAQENADTAKEKPDDYSREIFLQAAYYPGIVAKIGFTQYFTFPFLQGESPLTEDNNIKLGLTAEVSPVSLAGRVGAVWTPIAFFLINAGGGIGSGWNFSLLGSEVYGIGINYPDDNGHSKHKGSAFDGMQWNLYTGGTIQFDLAALIPGDWHHVVAKIDQSIIYKGYTSAEKNEAWYFENDYGENTNGFNYFGSYLVGYQMPLFLDMVAILAESNLYLYDMPNREKWGDNKLRWIISGALSFAVHKQLGILLAAQFETVRNYQEKNWEDLYYRNRTINKSDLYDLKFYRIAAIFTYKF